MSADTHVATSGEKKNNLENNNTYAITSKSSRTAVGTSKGYLISRAAIYNAAQSGRQAKKKKKSTLLAQSFAKCILQRRHKKYRLAEKEECL